jgi:hypothetical protein
MTEEQRQAAVVNIKAARRSAHAEADAFTRAGFTETEFGGWGRDGYRAYFDERDGWSAGFTFPDGIERIVGINARSPEHIIEHIEALIAGAKA